MKKIILINFVIGFFFTSCNGQSNRVENVIMECSYQAFADKGKAFKTLIKDYENLLIDEKILADNSGKSYRGLLEYIANGNKFDKEPSDLFSLELQKLKKPNIERAQECQKNIINDSVSYDISKLTVLEEAITSVQNSGDLDTSLIAKHILKVLTEEDFEYDFYKVRTFLLLSSVEVDSGINRRLPKIEENQVEYDLTNALEIILDSKSEIYVDKKRVTLVELKKLVRDYELKNKSESIFYLKVDRKTMYQIYIDVQNAIVGEIRRLRNELAKEKYKTELHKLTEKQLSEIKNVYPQILID